MFWRCMRITTTSHYCSSRFSVRATALDRFCAACGLDETQTSGVLASICQVELFERLGMAHTCCAGGRSGYSMRPEVPRKEQMRLQEEDFHLGAQLEMLMDEYHNGRLHYDGPSVQFWNPVVGDCRPDSSAANRRGNMQEQSAAGFPQ
jgi:hypothetical protein